MHVVIKHTSLNLDFQLRPIKVFHKFAQIFVYQVRNKRFQNHFYSFVSGSRLCLQLSHLNLLTLLLRGTKLQIVLGLLNRYHKALCSLLISIQMKNILNNLPSSRTSNLAYRYNNSTGDLYTISKTCEYMFGGDGDPCQIQNSIFNKLPTFGLNIQVTLALLQPPLTPF